MVVGLSVLKKQANYYERLNGDEKVLYVNGCGHLRINSISKGQSRHYELNIADYSYLEVVSEITKSESAFAFDYFYDLRNSDKKDYDRIQQT